MTILKWLYPLSQVLISNHHIKDGLNKEYCGSSFLNKNYYFTLVNTIIIIFEKKSILAFSFNIY